MTQGVVAIGAGQFVEHVSGAGEQHGVTGEHRLVGDVAGDHGLAHAVGADQDDVGGIREEAQAHQLLDGWAVALGGPVPVEVGQGFEAPEVGIAEAPFQAAAGAFVPLPNRAAGLTKRPRRSPPSGPAGRRA